MKDRPRRGGSSRPSTGNHRPGRAHRPVDPGHGGHRGHRRRPRRRGRRHRTCRGGGLSHPHPHRQPHRRVRVRRQVRGGRSQVQLTDRDLGHHRRRRRGRRCRRSRRCTRRHRSRGSPRNGARRGSPPFSHGLTHRVQIRELGRRIRTGTRLGPRDRRRTVSTRQIRAERPAVRIQGWPRRRYRSTGGTPIAGPADVAKTGAVCT